MKLSNLKIGDFFRFEGKKTVYVFLAKEKDGFHYYKFNDTSAFFSTKTDRTIETDFIF